MTFETILMILVSLNGDNITKDEKINILNPVAMAIFEASNYDRDKAAALIAIGNKESTFSRYVIENRCLEGKYKCDIDKKTGLPRAVGPWQIWKKYYKTGDIKTQAKIAIGRFMFFKRECKTWEGAFSGYAGRGCSTDSKWQEREKFRKKILKRL